jgi:hypothetical protein
LCYLRFMEQQEWYSTKEVAEILGISITRANQLMHKAIRNNPATKEVRKTDSVKNGRRLEMSSALLEQERRMRELNDEARQFIKPADVAAINAELTRLELEKDALKEELEKAISLTRTLGKELEAATPTYPLGSHAQRDGTFIYVYTAEEWDLLWDKLEDYQILKERGAEWRKQLEVLQQSHEAEISRLQQAYEDNVKMYQDQTQYLRQRLEATDTMLMGQQQAVIESLKAMRERNYIEAGIKQKE